MIAEYFARVGYAGSGSADLTTLRAVHALHVAAIPFENLSPFLGQAVPLDMEALVAKIIKRRRGGYCYEQNGLFKWILEELGYTSAVVKTAVGTYGWADEAPFDRIIVTAGAPAMPAPLFQQLAEGGRAVVPVGGPQSQVLHVVEKIDGRMRQSTDHDCTFVKLIGKYGWET